LQPLSFHIHPCNGYPRRSDSQTSKHFDIFPTYPLSFQILAYSFAIFCTRQNLNPFPFNRFRTLCKKTPGWGSGQSFNPTGQGTSVTEHQSRVTSHQSLPSPVLQCYHSEET
jgi:hypothetical protein